MSIIITIKDGKVNERGGEKDGRKWSRREQEGWVTLGNGEVRRIKLGLNKDQPAHAPGDYTLAPGDFYINDYSELGVSGWPKLQRLEAGKTKAA
jgi:hypothetical protein